MNARDWRKQGYKTVFDCGTVYLYRPMSGVVIHTRVENGRWMEHENVNRAPWVLEPLGIDGLPAQLRQRFEYIREHCYCDKGVDLCDFCAQVRKPWLDEVQS